MGGFGGGRNSGGGGNSNRERGAARNRTQKTKTRSSNTFYGNTNIGENKNQDLMTKQEKKTDNLKYGFSRIDEGLQAVDDYTTIGKIIENIDRRSTVGKTSEKQKGILRTDLRTGATYKNAPLTRKPTKDIGGEGQDKAKGIELAKASTTSATILGPAEIQKEAANNVKGPTTTEMTAGQISLANKRKGRRATNITAKKTLANNYTLSKKSLLG